MIKGSFRFIFCIFLFSNCNLNNNCKGPITFKISAIERNERVLIKLDDGLFVFDKRFKNGFIMNENKSYTVVNGYCSENDSVKVYVSIEDNCDTVIFINKTKVQTCFIGSDMKGCPSFLYDSIPPATRFSFE
jgi:hypothetical protein